MSSRRAIAAAAQLTIFSLGLSSAVSESVASTQPDWDWNLQRMATLDTAVGWTGPHPRFITVSDDRVEGSGALEVAFTIEAERHLRVERNFIHGPSDGLENMMGMGMRFEDFTPYRTIEFSFRMEVNASVSIIFRIWDRSGGWLDWTIPEVGPAGKWRTVVLSVPPAPGALIDMRRIGGLMFELRPVTGSVKGRAWFDNLRFITDTAEGGITAGSHPVPDRDYSREVAPLNIPNAFPSRDVRMCLNMSPVELTMWECDGPKAIKQLTEEMKRFDGIGHLDICINPGTQRSIREVPGYIEKSRDAFVQVARWCESKDIRFWQMAGCEGHGFLPPETIFAVMDAAPKCFMGVLFAESSVDTNNNVVYVVTLLERLAPAGKKVLYFQQSSYWLGIMHPHGRDFIREIMAPRFRGAFVPLWENLLPSSQGLCFATTVGFWRGGLTDSWGVSAQSWGYTNMNFGGTSDMPGHWWFRMFLAAAAAGATYVQIEPIWPFDGENTEGQIRHTKQWAHNLVWVGRMRPQVEIDIGPCEQIWALRWFDKLIAAGIVRPPARPEHAMSLSPVALRVVQSDNSYKWGMIRRALDENWWQMGDCPTSWEMSAQVPGDEIFGSLYSSSHFYDQTIPETSLGLVTIVPRSARLPADVNVIETDAYGVLDRGTWRDPKAARDIVADAYVAAAGRLPFVAGGCYCSVVRASPRSFLAYLIDAEERFPVGATTSLEIRMPGQWKCTDAISRQPLDVREYRIAVDIPAGGYRILLLENESE